MRTLTRSKFAGLLAILACLILSLGGCSEEEPANKCVVGSPCHTTLLYQCDCCDADKVAACKEKTTADCQKNNTVISGGSTGLCVQMNYTFETEGPATCSKISPDSIAKHCGAVGTGSGSGSPAVKTMCENMVACGVASLDECLAQIPEPCNPACEEAMSSYGSCSKTLACDATEEEAAQQCGSQMAAFGEHCIDGCGGEGSSGSG